MALTGGLRDRMVLQSVVTAITGEMTTLGWFNMTGKQYSEITILDEYPDDKDEVAINTMAFSLGGVQRSEMELGSNAQTLYFPIYVDFFAESDGLGRHVVGDIANFVNRVGQFTVYDYSASPTPTAEFVVLLGEGSLETTKPDRAVNNWQKHWHSVGFVVTEERPGT